MAGPQVILLAPPEQEPPEPEVTLLAPPVEPEVTLLAPPDDFSPAPAEPGTLLGTALGAPGAGQALGGVVGGLTQVPGQLAEQRQESEAQQQEAEETAQYLWQQAARPVASGQGRRHVQRQMWEDAYERFGRPPTHQEEKLSQKFQDLHWEANHVMQGMAKGPKSSERIKGRGVIERYAQESPEQQAMFLRTLAIHLKAGIEKPEGWAYLKRRYKRGGKRTIESFGQFWGAKGEPSERLADLYYKIDGLVAAVQEGDERNWLEKGLGGAAEMVPWMATMAAGAAISKKAGLGMRSGGFLVGMSQPIVQYRREFREAFGPGKEDLAANLAMGAGLTEMALEMIVPIPVARGKGLSAKAKSFLRTFLTEWFVEEGSQAVSGIAWKRAGQRLAGVKPPADATGAVTEVFRQLKESFLPVLFLVGGGMGAGAAMDLAETTEPSRNDLPEVPTASGRKKVSRVLNAIFDKLGRPEPGETGSWRDWFTQKVAPEEAAEQAPAEPPPADLAGLPERLQRAAQREDVQAWKDRATDPGVSRTSPKNAPRGTELRKRLPSHLQQAWDSLPDPVKRFHGIWRVKGVRRGGEAGGEFDHRTNTYEIDRDATEADQSRDFLHETVASYAAYYLDSAEHQDFYKEWARVLGRQTGTRGFFSGEDPAGGSDIDAFARSFVQWVEGNASPELSQLFEMHFAPQEKPPPRAPVAEAVEPGAVPPVTSIKNELVDELQARRGVKPLPAAEQETKQQWLDEAEARILEDPAWPSWLVQDLLKKPRPHTKIEAAGLSIYQRGLENSLATETAGLVDAFRSDDPVPQVQAQTNVNLISLDLEDFQKAVGRGGAGTEAARALAARQMMLLPDYSLAEMQLRARAAKGGESPTPAEQVKIKDIADRLARLEKLIAKWEAKLALAQADPAKAFARPGEKPRDKRLTKLQYQREQLQDRFRMMERAWRRSQRHPIIKVLRVAPAAINFLRAFKASFDLSAPRQAKYLIAAHPVRTLRKRAWPMVKALFSRYEHFRSTQEIRDRRHAPLYGPAELELTPAGGELDQMDEAFMSNLATKVPGVAGSGRAHVDFLNGMRADSFDALYDSLTRGGLFRRAGNPTLAEAKIIANFSNILTGRGPLGMLKSAAVGLATAFWSPRFVLSRFQILLGQPMWRGTMRTRLLIAEEYARSLRGIAIFYGMIHLAAALWPDDDEENRPVVEYDPRSGDFGKVRMGDTRIDPMGGLSQVTVVMARTITGKTKTHKGEFVALEGEERPYGGKTTGGLWERFIRSKLSPAFGTGVDLWTQEHFVPEQFTGALKPTPASVALNLTVPMSPADIIDAMENQGIEKGSALAIMAIFGDNVQTYDEDAWKAP